VDIDHLDGAEFFEDGAGLEGGKETVGEEAGEDVGFHAWVAAVVDRAQGEVALEVLEGLFNLGQEDVLFPPLGGGFAGDVTAQEVAALTAAGLGEAGFVE
jgi:hypothetical protein